MKVSCAAEYSPLFSVTLTAPPAMAGSVSWRRASPLVSSKSRTHISVVPVYGVGVTVGGAGVGEGPAVGVPTIDTMLINNSCPSVRLQFSSNSLFNWRSCSTVMPCKAATRKQLSPALTMYKIRPSIKAVAVGSVCCTLGAAFAGSHNPNNTMPSNENKMNKRFGFIRKIISGFI